MVANPPRPLDPTVTLGAYIFESVDSFVYLSSLVKAENLISHEVKRRILAANNC